MKVASLTRYTVWTQRPGDPSEISDHGTSDLTDLLATPPSSLTLLQVCGPSGHALQEGFVLASSSVWKLLPQRSTWHGCSSAYHRVMADKAS